MSNNLELIGKIKSHLPEQGGQGKNGTWKKQEFILDLVFETYPKSVCISLWGDKVNELQNYPPGSDVKVSFNIESREFNGRWYTDVRAWRIQPNGNGATGGADFAADPFPEEFSQETQGGGGDDLPF